ncbi:MAG: anti-sigma factor antagonist, partial [Betaproteobacteria bacterium]
DAGPDGVFRFDGDLVGASNEALRRLAAFGAERSEIVVDCARLRRIDFVCAGMLFNILSTLRAQGRLIALHNVNAMVGALLRVMSVDQVAQVTLRD